MRTLLVASSGGHLEELYRLLPRLTPRSAEVEWATFAGPQASSLLVGEVLHEVPYVNPRGYAAAAKNLFIALRILRQRRFDRVVSTGSGIAIPFMVAASVKKVSRHYIESAARSDGPSLTGRVVSRIPETHLYTQYPSWTSDLWSYRGSLFDIYNHADLDRHVPSPSKIVVTLGTMQTYGFRRAVDAVRAALDGLAPRDVEILWQVGATDVADLPLRTVGTIPADEMAAAMKEADLVIAHAGIGSALVALDAGRCPVLLPRRKAWDEHVDDHQVLIARELSSRGLAVSCDASELNQAHLLRAMRREIFTDTTPMPFRLDD